MTPEPSNEYQKLVEAVARAITEEIGWGSFSHFNPDDLRRISRAALSALKLPHAGDDGWNRAVEAAAEVAAKQYAGHGKTMRTARAHNYEHAGRTIATAIRKLARHPSIRSQR